MNDDTDKTRASHKGRELIKRYHDSKRHLDVCERDLATAIVEHKNSTNEFAKWLLPNDWNHLETFGIWDRDDYQNECLYVVTGLKDEFGSTSFKLETRYPIMMPQFDGRFFAWVHKVQAWSPPELTPQLIMDAGMFNSNQLQPQNKGVMTIVSKYMLKIHEYHLTLDELIARYPKPEGWIPPEGANS